MTGSIQHRNDRPAPWRARYRAPDGRQRSKSFKRKVDAVRWLRNELGKADRGEWVAPESGNTTFETVSKQWTRTRSNKRPSTQARDASVMANLVIPYLGERAVSTIRPSDLQAWVHGLEDAGKSPATIRKAWQIASGVLRLAVRDRLIASTPARDVELPALERDEKRFLSVAEVERLSNMVDTVYRPMILLGAYTGLRLGEVAGLRMKDLDLLRRRLTVSQTVSDVRGKLHVGPPKTAKSRRSVTMPKLLVDALALHVAGGENSPPPAAFVFADPAGGPIRRTNWARRVFAPAVRAAGLKPLTFHDLRHTHVALLIAQGENPRAIADRLGHTSVRTVLDVYGHLFPGADEDVADRLDQAIANPGVAQVWPKPETGTIVPLPKTQENPA